MCHFHVSKTGYGNMEVKYRLWRKGPVIPPVVVSLSRIVVLFTYGFLITKSVTDIAKYTVGRLRPHFLDVCKPNMSMVIRDGGCDRYITEAHCSTVNSTDPKEQYRLRDSRLSFLSGHAAMAFYRSVTDPSSYNASCLSSMSKIPKSDDYYLAQASDIPCFPWDLLRKDQAA